MKDTIIQKSTLAFLKKLAANNDRDWFAAHKSDYERAKTNAEGFVDFLISKMNVHDQLETPSGKKSLYRIYNDIRFASDKSPYNPRFAGYLKRTKPMLRGGYYFWIKPGASRLGCGFVYPQASDLARIRHDIASNYDDWQKMLKSKSIRTHWGSLSGDQVKTAPRGYTSDHPAIDLLRYKQYWFERSFTDREVLDKDFINVVNNAFTSIRPFFDYMSDVLTTDFNGDAVR